MSRFARRVDDNHAQVRDAFRGAGALVLDLSRCGEGVPDLLVGWRGRWLPVEVKDGSKSPSERALTSKEREVLTACRQHRLPWYLAESLTDVERILNEQ